MRSLLGQIRDVFPPERVAHFATELAWLGRLTGPPRDLDVLGLSLRTQRDDVPPDDLETLTTFLNQAQRQEYRQLVDALDGERYRRLIAEWTAFLEQRSASPPEAANATRLLEEVVSPRAWRLSRRIAGAADTIDQDAPAERLHAVRIDAKKLRYVIDVTPAFYDAADLERIVGALKRLQRVLGDFNDAHVQAERLLECRRALAAAGGPAGALAALARLAGQCRERRGQLRSHVAGGLARFGARDTRAACRRAFKRVGEPEHPQ
jgi:CHAD domain-containing protein